MGRVVRGGKVRSRKRKAAPGVDGMTWHDYEADLEPRIEDLHGRVHRGAYRPQPSRRTSIPKADGKQRPLAIAALEDKVVQGATVMALSMKATSAVSRTGSDLGEGRTMRWTRAVDGDQNTESLLRGRNDCAASCAVLPVQPRGRGRGVRQKEGFAFVEKSGEGFWLAELHRLDGQIALKRQEPDQERAEACFLQAMEIARSQEVSHCLLRSRAPAMGFPVCSPVSLFVTSLSRRQKARERLDELLLFERLSKYGSVSISVLYFGNAIAGDENERHPAGS